MIDAGRRKFSGGFYRYISQHQIHWNIPGAMTFIMSYLHSGIIKQNNKLCFCVKCDMTRPPLASDDDPEPVSFHHPEDNTPQPNPMPCRPGPVPLSYSMTFSDPAPCQHDPRAWKRLQNGSCRSRARPPPSSFGLDLRGHSNLVETLE